MIKEEGKKVKTYYILYIRDCETRLILSPHYSIHCPFQYTDWVASNEPTSRKIVIKWKKWWNISPQHAVDVKNSPVDPDGLMEEVSWKDFYLNFVSSECISGHTQWQVLICLSRMLVVYLWSDMKLSLTETQMRMSLLDLKTNLFSRMRLTICYFEMYNYIQKVLKQGLYLFMTH